MNSTYGYNDYMNTQHPINGYHGEYSVAGYNDYMNTQHPINGYHEEYSVAGYNDYGNMQNINSLLKWEQLGVLGNEGSIDQVESVFKIPSQGPLVSMGHDLLLYIFFTDLVDIEAIEIEANAPCYGALYKFQLDLDFGNIGYTCPDKSFYIYNEPVEVKMKNVDYLTLYLKADEKLTVNQIIFYGRLNPLNTRETDKVKLYWAPGACERHTSVVRGETVIGRLGSA